MPLGLLTPSRILELETQVEELEAEVSDLEDEVENTARDEYERGIEEGIINDSEDLKRDIKKDVDLSITYLNLAMTDPKYYQETLITLERLRTAAR